MFRVLDAALAEGLPPRKRPSYQAASQAVRPITTPRSSFKIIVRMSEGVTQRAEDKCFFGSLFSEFGVPGFGNVVPDGDESAC